MEISSVCPYCGKEMKDGAIPTYQRRLEWCPRSEEYGGIVEGEGVPLSTMPVLGGVYAASRYCEDCKVVIVPVPEIETLADKADRWLNKTIGSLGNKLDETLERREEKKTERKKKERREKDPWEV